MSYDTQMGQEIHKALLAALQGRGRANIVVAGRTGVGKSTLVNAVFQGNLATTGQGKPVTLGTREITKEGVPVSIFDTRGLELNDFEATLDAVESLIEERRKEPDPSRHIHLAWICVAEDSRRVEESESRFVERLGEYMPVIAVITKARSDRGFRSQVQNLLSAARNVIRVRAISEQFDDGHTLPVMGLKELVDLTVSLLPEGQRNALVAAQKIDIELKKKQAREVVTVGASAALLAGATPIPFADAALLVPIQISMLAGITAVFGMPLNEAFLSTLIGSAATSVGATITGRAIVASLLKLVPGAGSAAGAVISGVTAAAVTTAFGEAYINALSYLFSRDINNLPSTEDVITAFQNELKNKKE